MIPPRKRQPRSGIARWCCLMPMEVVLLCVFWVLAHVALRQIRAHRYVVPVRIGAFSGRPQSKPLMDAIEKKDIDAVKRLLESGVSPDSVDNPNARDRLSSGTSRC